MWRTLRRRGRHLYLWVLYQDASRGWDRNLWTLRLPFFVARHPLRALKRRTKWCSASAARLAKYLVFLELQVADYDPDDPPREDQYVVVYTVRQVRLLFRPAYLVIRWIRRAIAWMRRSSLSPTLAVAATVFAVATVVIGWDREGYQTNLLSSITTAAIGAILLPPFLRAYQRRSRRTELVREQNVVLAMIERLADQLGDRYAAYDSIVYEGMWGPHELGDRQLVGAPRTRTGRPRDVYDHLELIASRVNHRAMRINHLIPFQRDAYWVPDVLQHARRCRSWRIFPALSALDPARLRRLQELADDADLNESIDGFAFARDAVRDHDPDIREAAVASMEQDTSEDTEADPYRIPLPPSELVAWSEELANVGFLAESLAEVVGYLRHHPYQPAKRSSMVIVGG